MKLSLKNRLSLNFLFPERATLLEQMTVKEIAKKVEVTEEERIECNMRMEGERLLWDESKTKEKEVEFTDTELVFLKGRIDKLDADKQITTDMVDLCLLIKDK